MKQSFRYNLESAVVEKTHVTCQKVSTMRGILATGCRRFGIKNDAKGQKRRKMAKNDANRQNTT